MVRLFESVSATALAALTLSAALVSAHPGEHHTPAEIKREQEAHASANLRLGRALKSCATAPGFAARQEKAAARRIETAHALRQKRGIQSTTIQPAKYKRDDAAIKHWMSVSHDQTQATGFSLDTPAAQLFAGNASCALVPEQTIGPYYVAGELIREDITEGQRGVPLHVEVEFVDVANCEAVPQLAIDLWQCNATGVYSGVDAAGQAGVATTWLRGVQISDTTGVASFDTIFPGHYAGRTSHIHVMATRDPRVLDSTQQFEGGVPTHIGQFYFDEKLIGQVEAVEPYKSNDKLRLTNDQDFIAVAAATAENDIFMDYVLLGDDISDGVLAWITVGIDADADRSRDLSVAATASPHASNGTMTHAPTPSAGTGSGAGTSTIATTVPTAGARKAIAKPFLLGW